MSQDAELGRGLTCFIIGPIGDRLEPPGTPGRLRYEDATQIWENVFEPACAVFGLTPVRADKISESGEIPEQIFTYLRDADVVIADLTGGNANVMYELGLRHTRDKITIQIGQHERLPFDVNTIRTVKFRRTEAGLIDARNGLVEALRVALQGSGTPVTATRVWNSVSALEGSQIEAAVERSRESDDPTDDLEDVPGAAELLADGEAALGSVGEDLERVGGAFEQLTEVSQEHLPGLNRATSFAARLPIIKQFAEALKEPTALMDTAADDYLAKVLTVDAMIDVLAEIVVDDALGGEQATEIAEFRESMAQLAESAEGASSNFTETLAVIRQMKRWSNMLKPASRSLEHSLNTILRGNALVTEWPNRLGAHGDDEVPPST